MPEHLTALLVEFDKVVTHKEVFSRKKREIQPGRDIFVSRMQSEIILAHH